jgi:hypothetical protein
MQRPDHPPAATQPEEPAGLQQQQISPRSATDSGADVRLGRPQPRAAASILLIITHRVDARFIEPRQNP